MPEQSRYEVRFDWGEAGLAAVAPGVGAIVLVDVLPDAAPRAALADAAARYGVPVSTGGVEGRAALAAAVLAAQEDAGRRLGVAVVAAGEPRDDGSLRVCVEDLLAAGAVIDALAEAGLDACSPEAAAAAAAFTALERAYDHLVSASTSAVSRD